MPYSYLPSEENLERVLRGEMEDPVPHLSAEQLHEIIQSRKCPRDGRTMGDRDNPRCPGLNREFFCSCGFAVTE